MTRIGRLFTFSLVVITILFFIQLLTKSEILSKSEKTEPVPLPTGMHPVVEERTNQLIQQSADKGIVVVITDSFRSVEEQNLLYEKGRSTEESVVTNAKGGESYHNYGLAIDFALKTPSGEVTWDMNYDRNGNSKADWTEVVLMAKELGFEWGGDWIRFKDYPHLQMDFGLSIADLQQGERPPGTSLTADVNR